MNRNVFITCAVTGAGDTVSRSDKVPVTPEQIANDAIDAAKAGAAIVHCHVRDPATGKPSRSTALYREVVDRIRDSATDVVINLTAGHGGDLVLGGTETPIPINRAASDMAGATERLEHLRACLPEICTLDCGTMNFGEGDYIMTNSPAMLRDMAKQMQQIGVKPEVEVFDLGHLAFTKQLVKEGLIDDPVLIQLCMGVPWGAPNDLSSLLAMVNNIPSGWHYSGFSIGPMQLPYSGLMPIAGGNVRVGLEDNIYLSKGVLATNAQLVERAATIISAMGLNILGPSEVREKLNLQKRSPA